MSGVKGRGRAGRAAVVAIVVAVGLLAMEPAAYAANHVVGGATQKWNYAPSNDATYYDKTWAPKETFAVGDTLEFKYGAGAHNVAEFANKGEYDACAGTPVRTLTSGDDFITLNSSGTKYYYCSFLGHCTQGMKVAVTVGATPPTAAPATPPTTTPPTPATPTPPTAPAPSAASFGSVVSMAGLLAAALVAGLAFLV